MALYRKFVFAASAVAAFVAATSVSAQTAAPAAVTPADVARLFVAACVRHEGRAVEVIDWALAQGFAPAGDPRSAPLPPLLDGSAGAVLALPVGGGNVLLAASDGDRCTLWAERQSGPALRMHLQRELDALARGGARVRIETDRNLVAAGQWRNLRQWRYRHPGATGELTLGAVTTLVDAPAEQALNLAPVR